MGLIVSVYRNAEDNIDCTMNGISSRYKKLLLVNVPGPFDPANHKDCAPALLESHHQGCLRIVEAVNTAGPAQSPHWQQRPGWCMMGGNYAATSDSRFSEACERLLGRRFYGAVAVHDRYEG